MSRLRRAPGAVGPGVFLRGDLDAEAQGGEFFDFGRRVRGRARPEPREPARFRRRPASRLGLPDPDAPADGLRGRRRDDGTRRRLRRARVRECRLLDPRPEHVRPGPRPVARRELERLVGRGPALPRPGLRPDAPRAASARDGGRNDVPLRDGRDPRGAGASTRRRRGARRPPGRGPGHDPAVPARGSRRRAAPRDRPRPPRRRRAALRRDRPPRARLRLHAPPRVRARHARHPGEGGSP